MAYSTGSASTLVGLIDALRVALIAEGWTIHRWDDTWLAAQPFGGPLVFHWVISSTTSTLYPAPRLYLSASTSYNGGAAWDGQTGQPSHTADTFSESWIAPFGAYHFFVGADYAHMVVRADDGMWRHAQVGMMEPASSDPAGYLQHVKWERGSTTSTHNAAASRHHIAWGNPASSLSPRACWIWTATSGWQQTNSGFSPYAIVPLRNGENTAGDQAYLTRLHLRAANAFNAITPLLPIGAAMMIETDAHWMAGYAKDLRLVRMDYLQPGDLITIGAEEWLAFPAINRGYTEAGSMIPASGMIGFAYRRSIG